MGIVRSSYFYTPKKLTVSNAAFHTPFKVNTVFGWGCLKRVKEPTMNAVIILQHQTITQI